MFISVSPSFKKAGLTERGIRFFCSLFNCKYFTNSPWTWQNAIGERFTITASALMGCFKANSALQLIGARKLPSAFKVS